MTEQKLDLGPRERFVSLMDDLIGNGTDRSVAFEQIRTEQPELYQQAKSDLSYRTCLVLTGRGSEDEDPPESLKEFISRYTRDALQEALEPLSEQVEALVQANRPRFEMQEHPFGDKPYRILENLPGGGQENLGEFSRRSDAENFLEFLRMGGWDGEMS